MKQPEKPKRAVGIKYEHGQDDAPYVVAKGEGFDAEEILRIARENKTPITHDGGMLDALFRLDYAQTIPPELFEVVAEILFFAYESLGKDPTK